MKRTVLVLLLMLLYVASSCDGTKYHQTDPQTVIIGDSLKSMLSNAFRSQTSEEEKNKLLSDAIGLLDSVNNDSIRLGFLSELSLKYLAIRDSANFRVNSKKVLELASEIGDSTRVAESYWDLGTFYGLENVAKRDSAYYYLSQAQKLYTLLGNRLSSARVLLDMAAIQTDVHDNTGAMVNATEAIKSLKFMDDDKNLYRAYNIMGVAAAALNEFEKAIEYYNLASEYVAKINHTQADIASISNNKGLLYFDQGDFVKAKLEFSKTKAYDSLYFISPYSYARVLDHLAMTNLALGTTASVEQDLLRALRIRDSIGDQEGISLNYYNLAQYYLEEGNRSEAYSYASKAKDLSKDIDNNLRYLESLKLLMEIDPNNIAAYNEEYVRIQDSLLLEERRIRNKFERIRFETDETLAENEVLARQRMLWAGIAMGVFLFGVALMIIVLQRIKNQRLRFQQQQQEANQEIFNLMLSQKQKVEEGKQSEQKRISEELHDGILGEMNGIRMVLLGLNNKKDEAAIAFREQAIEKLKEVQEEIRTISHELNDASYQKFHNFINSLEDLLKNICEPAKLTYQLTYDHDVDWDNLQGITKINLYRIFQESLQNCVKHAQASKVYVSMETNEKDMVITIQDNGRGFDTVKSKKGIGHRNIKSRMNKIKGRWYLKSAPGVGTTLILEIPLEHISQEAKKGISLPKDLLEV